MARISLVLVALAFSCRGGSTQSPVTSPSVKTPATPESSVAQDLSVKAGHDTISVANKEGVRVVLVPVQSKSEPNQNRLYLLRATGTDSEFDGLVLQVRRKTTGDRQFFIAHLRGAPYVPLSHQKGTDAWTWHGYDHGEEEERLRHMNQPVDVDLVLGLRAKPGNAALAKIETTQRSEIERWQNTRLQEAVSGLPDSCGEIDISIDWSEVSDAMFKEQSISGECQIFVSTIGDFCEQHWESSGQALRNSSFVCAYRGDGNDKRNFQLTRTATGKYLFSPGGGNEQHNKILHFLRVNLDETTQVYRVGKRHVIMKHEERAIRLFSGIGDTFYPLGENSDVRPKAIHVDDGPIQTSFVRDSDKGIWSLRCDFDSHPMQTLRGSERQAILSRAKFEKEAKWKRQPYSLSRDMRGTYYYVDRYQPRYGGKRYRVFVGRRGQLKLSKLTGVVEDNEGTLFSTERGELRLVVSHGKKTATWIRGRKMTKLTTVDIRNSSKLIFDELGVYFSDDLGFICD